jgi:hypothetical protein
MGEADVQRALERLARVLDEKGSLNTFRRRAGSAMS